MFSPPAATHHGFTPLSPSLGQGQHYSPIPSPVLGSYSPNPSNSPYRLPPLPRPSSGGDLVSGIVDKFNSLSVTDREEEKGRYERQIAKLKQALERATVAREEAESEARGLRAKLLEVQDERVRERDYLRERCGEYEKKYEKAKERFKQQRARNEEVVQALKGEFLEKEKGHWRNVAVAQEAEEWERRLRVEASELVEFVELEKRFELELVRRRWTAPAVRESVKEDKKVQAVEIRAEVMDLNEEAIVLEEEENGEGEKTLVVPEQRQRRVLQEVTIESRPVSRGSDTAHSETDDRLNPQSDHESLREVTPEGPPSMSIRPFATPARQVIRVPVNFDDVEDKENKAPATVADVLKTPMTMDRAAALAAIEYRRGRARSFMNAQMTPKTLGIADKRDVSAPATVTMTVGRKR
ncbi:hypothetical protein KVT40_008852 [Elsinoe batatas]|uniref:Uncharacterized protein n=1 Tax=Elsinoe batatas TaxID=2601811 RepID=A0A8K0KTX8_9PEZI|nr:hypothetical protein KVT40_008852 [Elsinoe batatas]